VVSQNRNEFLSIRDWHQAVVGGEDVILRRTSALEYLQLFNGYLYEKEVDVYAKQCGDYDNVNYCLVDSFDGIDCVRIDDMLCTTANQTFNEMLADYDNIDGMALIEGLAGYYYSNGESFDGLTIKPENLELFNKVKEGAIEFYCGG
jgi:hypothetical protein